MNDIGTIRQFAVEWRKLDAGFGAKYAGFVMIAPANLKLDVKMWQDALGRTVGSGAHNWQ